MKNWNTTGKIKAALVGLSLLTGLFTPAGATMHFSLIMIILPLLFFGLLSPLIIKLNAIIRERVLAKPNWNDNPLMGQNPVVMFQFAGFFFMAIGIGKVIRAAIVSHVFHTTGLLIAASGLGLLIGTWLAVKWFVKSNTQ